MNNSPCFCLEGFGVWRNLTALSRFKYLLTYTYLDNHQYRFLMPLSFSNAKDLAIHTDCYQNLGSVGKTYRSLPPFYYRHNCPSQQIIWLQIQTQTPRIGTVHNNLDIWLSSLSKILSNTRSSLYTNWNRLFGVYIFYCNK